MTTENPLSEYKFQLSAVEESLKTASGDDKENLLDLKQKLIEVISLLQDGECGISSASCNGKESKSDSLDDEFLKFQMEIGALVGDAKSEDTVDGDESLNDAHDELQKVLSSMEGQKCRAPFSRKWGEKAYHNALIFSTDIEDQNTDDLNNVQVKVMFCNPLCDEMKPCPFFLDGHCKFDADNCRFSHGYSVKYSDLEEYCLPDYSNVQRDSKCLAKYKNGLWYTAVIENCLEDSKFFVKYDTFGTTDTLAVYDILPLGNLSLSDDDDDDSSSTSSSYSLNDQIPNDVEQPKEINYVTDIGSSPLGAWEQHTKGIGSKLMAKMGYVWGQGLGKNSDGRIEPVEAIVLPKGKSLDKCAELREISGPVSVEDRFSAEQVKEEERAKKIDTAESNPSVFDFLNKNIARGSGSHFDGLHKRPAESSNEPKKKSQNTDLNFQMYSVGEDIKKTKKEISRIKESLNRNIDRNETACNLLKQRMTVQSSILKQLEAKEVRISSELNKQKSHKKIVSF